MTSFATIPTKTHLPLGIVLQMAGLISESQVAVALQDQAYNHNMLLGEILVLRGWIHASTVEFFVEHFHCAKNLRSLRFGDCLKKAGLLTEQQIQQVLQEQNHSWIKFGAAAVLRGFIKQETLDFFKEHFFPKEEKSSDYRHKKQIPQSSPCDHSTEESLEEAILKYFADDDDDTSLDNSGDLDIYRYKWN